MSEDFNSVQEAAQGEESIVDGVRRELEEIDSSDLSEHAARFEALHKKLQDSLNSIDGL
jgi:archaellum component FlaC